MRDLAKHRIESVETFAAGSCVFVKLTTASGIVGIGESTAFAFPGAVVSAIESMKSFVVGSNPLDVEKNWLMLYRALGWRGLTLGGAISAIDQASWDIKSRIYEAPIWEVLGGQSRTGVRAMRVVAGNSLEEVVTQSVAAQNEGYTAIKVILHMHEHHQMRHAEKIKDMVDRLAAIRDAVGLRMDIGVELHRNMQPGNSLTLIDELERFHPLFVEDPVPPDSVLSFGEVSKKSRISMAAGERNTSIYEFREYIEHAGISFVRPDIGIAGGFTHVQKICAMAEAHHQGVIPHCVPNGPVATMAHIHMGISAPNWEVQEYMPLDVEPFTSMVDQVPTPVNGYFYPVDSPGLGINLNEHYLKSAPVTSFKISPDLREDGSVALR
jgi:galactonate dehydratase